MGRAVDIDLLELRRLITEKGYSIAGAAEHFHCHHNTIYKLCKFHRIDGPNFKIRVNCQHQVHVAHKTPRPAVIVTFKPLPVSLAMRRLAQFDPVIRRAMYQRIHGVRPSE